MTIPIKGLPMSLIFGQPLAGILHLMTLGGVFEFSGWLFRSSFGSRVEQDFLSQSLHCDCFNSSSSYSSLHFFYSCDFTGATPQPSPFPRA
jgi:hypothetical protein